MKKKIKVFIKETTCCILATSMLVGVVNSNAIVYANEKENDIKKDYIIVANSDKIYDDLIDEIYDDLSEENLIFSENNIMVAELSEEEATSLDKKKGVIIEEDIIITANSENGVGFNEKKDKKSAMMKKRLEAEKNALEEDVVAEETEWNLLSINTEELTPDVESQQKVRVAVLDSGVDIVLGIDLADSINLVDTDDEFSIMFLDETGHGTSIAGIIAGNGEDGIQGINPDVELVSVKVLDGANAAPISRIIEGIYWCIENDINIINLSIGTSVYSHALKKAVEDAYAANILMVGAAGNNTDEIEYPAAFDEVMAIASTNTSAEISSFSNTGEKLDVAAPGEKIKTTGFFSGTIVTHGTSIAVPHVVGVASLLWEKDLTQSNEFIRQLINYSAKDIANTDECGLLDAKQALGNYEAFVENFDGDHLLNEDKVPLNTEPAETFEHINDDEAYVEGRWSASGNMVGHEDLLTGSTSGLSQAAITIIKAGIIYNDYNSCMKGFSEYHGLADVNYIACYEYLSEIALNNGNAKGILRSDIYGLSRAAFDCIEFDFDGTYCGAKKWNKALVNRAGNALPSTGSLNKDKKYFTWGIALHVLSDTFAHDTYEKQSGKLIVHRDPDANEIGGADSSSAVPGRFKAAARAVKESVQTCVRGNVYGDYWEIFLALDGDYSKIDFLKENLTKYAKSNSGSSTVYGLIDTFNVANKN